MGRVLLISCAAGIALVAGAANAAAPDFTTMSGAGLWRAASALCHEREGVAIQMRAAGTEPFIDKFAMYGPPRSPSEIAAHEAARTAERRLHQAELFQRRAAEFTALYAELAKRTPPPPLDDTSQRVLVQGKPIDAADVETACKVLMPLAVAADK